MPARSLLAPARLAPLLGLIGALGLSSASTLLAAPPKRGTEYLAIMVGSSSYHGTEQLETLKSADNDVARLLWTLQDLLPPANVRVLIQDPDASARQTLSSLGIRHLAGAASRDLAEAFVWLDSRTRELQAAGREVRAVVYFSAHGDVGVLHLQDGKLSGSSLNQSLGALSADTVLLVADACFSGTLQRIKGAAELSAEELFPVEAIGEVIRGLERVGSITIQSAGIEDPLVGGLLTFELSSALLGAADLNQDRLITFEELETWLKALGQTRYVRSRETVQPPHEPLERPAIVMDLRRLPLRGLLFPPNSSPTPERYLVRDARGQLVAEFAKGGGDRRRLYLPAGSYSVQRYSPPDAWLGQEGVLEVRDGTTAVGLDSLAGWWRWPGKGAAPVEEEVVSGLRRQGIAVDEGVLAAARPLTEAEMTHNLRSRSHSTSTWRDLPHRVVTTVSATANGSGQVPERWWTPLGLEHATADSLQQDALARDGATAGVGLTVDGWVTPVGHSYLTLGAGLRGLWSPDTQLEAESGVPVLQLEVTGRLGLQRPLGSLALQGTLSGGALFATPRGLGSESAESLRSMPKMGLEAALILRGDKGPAVTLRLGPECVLEPQLRGTQIQLVPYLSLEGGIGVAW